MAVHIRQQFNSDNILEMSITCWQCLKEKNFQEVRRLIPGPQILLGPPQALLEAMALNHFLSDGCRSSFKSEGITIFACS